MSRTIRQILKDTNRSGAELGLVLMEKLRNQVLGEQLCATDKEMILMTKELPAQELGIFTLYETIYNTILNIYNFSRQTTFKFYASYNAIITLQEKFQILDCINNCEDSSIILGENLTAIKNTVENLCPKTESLKGKTKETYEMMFEALTFIEASNTFVRHLLSHFNITGLNCLQHNTDEYYSLLEKLKISTEKLASGNNKGEGDLSRIFFPITQTEKKYFTPEPRNLSEFKEFLKNEPNRVIKNSFSFIMLLQNKKEVN